MRSVIKSIIYAVIVILSPSCASPYFYQILSTKQVDDTSSPNNCAYEDANCSICYDFWSSCGEVRFLVTNKTDEFMYIDMKQSFFILNDIAYDYYRNRTFVRRVAGGASDYIVQNFVAQSIECVEQEIVSIPPHSSKMFGEYCIMDGIYRECGLLLYPEQNNSSKQLYFDAQNSPIQFKNIITYKVGNNDEVVISNRFYVNEIFNIPYSSFSSRKLVDKDCMGKPIATPYYKDFNNYKSATKFYIRYMRSYDNEKY